jgi:hypothetical protein
MIYLFGSTPQNWHMKKAFSAKSCPLANTFFLWNHEIKPTKIMDKNKLSMTIIRNFNFRQLASMGKKDTAHCAVFYLLEISIILCPYTPLKTI